MKPKRASRRAMRRSHAAAITAPAPTATPLTAAMTGRRTSRMLWISAPVTRVNSSSPCVSRAKSSRDDVLDVAAGAEAAALAGDDDGADVGARRRATGRSSRSSLVDLEGERVEALGAVERDRARRRARAASRRSWVRWPWGSLGFVGEHGHGFDLDERARLDEPGHLHEAHRRVDTCPCARASPSPMAGIAARYASRSVTKTRSFTRCSVPPPASRTTAITLSSVCRNCVAKSGLTMRPSLSHAICPATYSSAPRGRDHAVRVAPRPGKVVGLTILLIASPGRRRRGWPGR